MLSNFVGAVGNLMAESGLSELLSSVFAGVSKMLIGKKFPMCMHALRIVVEVILSPLLEIVECYEELMDTLEGYAQRSFYRTCKLWFDCLI